MKYNTTKTPLQCMMTQSTCYRQTGKMDVKGVLWHSTGCNNTWLKRYVQPDDNALNRMTMIGLLGKNTYGNDWNHTHVEAGLNAWIGKLADGTVATVQTMPWNYRPWGCGSGYKGSCNTGWIQFEICEDALTNKKYFEEVYKEACELTAYLCKTFNIDPNGTVNVNGVTVPTILCHNDSFKLGLGSGHADVYHWFGKYGKTMADVRKDVAALLKPATTTTTTTTTTAKTSNNTSAKFRAGDTVKIVGSTYYSGKTVPAWVKAKEWIVYSVSADGGRVIINKSADGVNAIMSPFKSSDLAIVNMNVVEVGDTVRITGAKYYSGGVIPSWVKNQNWIVYSAPENSDRIVINKSADGKSSIMSPVKRTDLIIVKKH